MAAIIEVENLSFCYDAAPIFSEVRFTLNKGDFLAIIGSNGTGKSTLMRLILGEIPVSQGSIRLFGQEIRRFKDWTRIGYMPQYGIAADDSFPATSEEIVRANLYSEIGMFRFPKKAHREQTRRALSLTDMERYAKRQIGTLSGGQRQRVMLSRVLVGSPELMILDEPSSGIDAETSLSIYKLLARLNRQTGLSIMMVTHDIARVSKYVSRVLCLEEGSLLELEREQLQRELSHRHTHPRRKGEDQLGDS